MSFIVFLLLLTVQGLIVGGFARLALPGRDPLTIPQTLAVGLAGTFVAGILVRLLTGAVAPGFLASLVFAVLILYVIRRRRGGGLTEPGGSARPGPGRRVV